MLRRLPLLLSLPALVLLGGCEIPGMEDPAKVAEAREADGKAIGGACRHSGRALEDCYMMNPKAVKAAIYAGWRDMDAYMRENNIQAVVPDLVDPPLGGKEPAAAEPEKAPQEKPGAEKAKKPETKRSAVEAPPTRAAPRRFS